ncbi:MerR family transcriptional regulator [Ktedonosporobacter rubrisoli]|uniref:MerR family transcriptional regulator n=1 Tax=Ktedonosporobacter rubrisoli TaxID=2509675 RepID=A0A4P6JXR9_KTERU|nr:MerR family transcriptional regulator [Ktedonosporobacter rubrisoli]QBD80223.1 MerR family transcriptional regulator [Ktedonosporobacter rubrisoli]
MKDELTIQEVAEQTGLSVHTLRYYERVGLLDAIERASSGHRRYKAVDVTWILFLTRLRATGMSIRQMQDFANMRRRGATEEERLAFLEEHQRLVRAHMRELEDHMTVIETKIAHYKRMIAQGQNVGLELIPIESRT